MVFHFMVFHFRVAIAIFTPEYDSAPLIAPRIPARPGIPFISKEHS